MRHSHTGLTAIAMCAAAALVGCARQAVVESEPARAGVSARASEETLRDELARLAAAQNAFYRERGYYADDATQLDVAPAPGVRLDIIQGDRGGWSATARSGDAECAIYSGEVRSPRGYLARPDVASCRP